MTEQTFQRHLQHIINGGRLDRDQATRAFQIIMNGGATPAQIAAFIVALKIRGETRDEITGAAMVLRTKALAFNGVSGMVDTCGTGGDARGTLNISTAVAIVLAACGVAVAKHGNRAVSSQSGSADILAELGVKIEAPIAVLEQSLRNVGMCFLYAPQFHTAMRHVALVRQELGMRTIFNLLGPLVNPAKPTRQLLGVYDKQWLQPMAEVLAELGSEKAWVVCGSDGLDELTLAGETHIAALENGRITTFTITPSDAGLDTVPTSELKGGDVRHNAQALREILLGSKGAYRDCVLLNTAAALIVADKVKDLKEGVALAARAIDEGDAYKTLQKLIDASHEKAAA